MTLVTRPRTHNPIPVTNPSKEDTMTTKPFMHYLPALPLVEIAADPAGYSIATIGAPKVFQRLIMAWTFQTEKGQMTRRHEAALLEIAEIVAENGDNGALCPCDLGIFGCCSATPDGDCYGGGWRALALVVGRARGRMIASDFADSMVEA